MGSGCRKVVDKNDKKEAVDNETTKPLFIHTNVEKFHLNITQKRILLISWDKIRDKNEFCRNMYRKLFVKDPTLRKTFQFSEDEMTTTNTDEAPSGGGKFQSHVKNLASFLNYLITNLASHETVARKIAEVLGKKHATFTAKSRNFKIEQWKLMEEALNEQITETISTLKDLNNLEKINSGETWVIFTRQLVSIMTKAYEKEKQEREKNANERISPIDRS